MNNMGIQTIGDGILDACFFFFLLFRLEETPAARVTALIINVPSVSLRCFYVTSKGATVA